MSSEVILQLLYGRDATAEVPGELPVERNTEEEQWCWRPHALRVCLVVFAVLDVAFRRYFRRSKRLGHVKSQRERILLSGALSRAVLSQHSISGRTQIFVFRCYA